VNFIQVHKWVNSQQSYIYVGNLICEMSENNGAVSFHYEKEYTDYHGASLDPKNLNISNGRVFPQSHGNGVLPNYFYQFLPGQYASNQIARLVPEWDSFNDFQKLQFCSKHFGDHHAIQLNAHNSSQDNSIIHDKQQLKELVELITHFVPESSSKAIIDTPIFELCSLSGVRPKFEFTDESSGQRWIAKPNSNPFYDESKTRVITNMLSDVATIDTVESYLDDDMEIAIQSNFKHAFYSSHTSHKLLKLNAIPLDILKPESAQTLIYSDIADMIKEYSCNVKDDLAQLHRRAIFDAAINSTRNTLDNFYFVDIAINKWRLAPSFASLPNPNTSDKFDTPFTLRAASRSLFTPDQLFSLELGLSLGIAPEVANQNFFALEEALKQLPQLLEELGDENAQRIFDSVLSPYKSFNNAPSDDVSQTPEF